MFDSRSDQLLQPLCRPLIQFLLQPPPLLCCLPAWCVWLATSGGNVEGPFCSHSQRIFFFFLCSRWHSSDADSNSHLPSNSLISSAFNQGIWCRLVALLFWLISTNCVFECLHWFQTVWSVLFATKACLLLFGGFHTCFGKVNVCFPC